MKTHLLFVLIFFVLLKTFSNEIRLNKGQEFSYNISEYKETLTKKLNDPGSENESLLRLALVFTVIDSVREKYILEANTYIIDKYERKYDITKHAFQTVKNFSHLLNSDTNEIQEINKSTFHINNVKFELFKNGKIGQILNLDSSKNNISGELQSHLLAFKHYPYLSSPEDTIPLFKRTSDKAFLTYYFSTFFFNLNNRNNKHLISNNIDFKIVENDNNTIIKRTIKVNDTIFDRYEFIIDKYSGLLSASNQIKGIYLNTVYLIDPYLNEKIPINHETKGRLYSYIQKVSKNSDPYVCKYQINEDPIQDTNFQKTNVLVRGKIENVDLKNELSLSWKEILFNFNTDRIHKYISNVKQDGTFEIRLFLDDIKKFNFNYCGPIPIYLKPGDDLFISFDAKNKAQTISIKGVRGELVDFMIKKFQFEKHNKIDNISLNKNAQILLHEKTPYEFKNHFLKILKNKLEFISDYKYRIPPEAYLAEIWHYKLFIYKILKDGSHKYDFNNKQSGKISDISNDENFNDFFNKFHPDNDLMLFSINTENERFLTNYLFYDLRISFGEVSGINFSQQILSNSKDELRLKSKYMYAEFFFSGKTEHLLKYHALLDIFDKANWSTIQEYYNKFKQEYPSSPKLETLKYLYLRLQKIAPGKVPYDFELKNINGDVVKLSDYKNKVVYLQFIHTGFSVLNEMREILQHSNSLREKLSSDIVFIFIDFNNNREERLNFIKNDGDSIKGMFLSAENHYHILKDTYFDNNLIPNSKFIINRYGEINRMRAPGPKEILKDTDIIYSANWLYKEDIQSKTIKVLKIVLIIILALSFIMFVYFMINKKRVLRKQRLTNLNSRVRELELTAIRAQMNPHFMYNCLNSIQNLVQKGKTKEAHLYLSKFASLIRRTLKYSDKEEITLHEEIELIREYIELEQLRFKLDFQITIDESIDIHSFFVPPLLLHPLVENAILHGLGLKKGDKKLSIEIKKYDNRICIFIKDNGVGRIASAKISKATTGKGINFIKERLAILSEKFDTNFTLNFTDLTNPEGKAEGTQVEICLTDD